MATLSSELQGTIEDLDTKHTALIEAVRAYKDGSLAKTANELMDESDRLATVLQGREQAMLGYIATMTDKKIPSLILDFANNTYLAGARSVTEGGAFTDVIDFSRSSEATFCGAGGLLARVGADVPRLTHDPVTGESKGLMIESFNKNHILHSENLTENTWTKARVTATRDTSTMCPDGTLTATLISLTAETGAHYVAQSGSLTADYYYVKSIFLKYGGMQFARVQTATQSWAEGSNGVTVDLINKTITELTGDADKVFITEWANDWIQVSVVNQMGSVDNLAGLLVGPALTGTGSVIFEGTEQPAFYAWGGEIKLGSTPSSYIRTYGSSASRQQDVAKVYLKRFGSLNYANMSYYMDISEYLPSNAKNPALMGLHDEDSVGSLSNTKYMYGKPGAMTLVSNTAESLNVGLYNRGQGRQESGKFAFSMSNATGRVILAQSDGTVDNVAMVSPQTPISDSVVLRLMEHPSASLSPPGSTTCKEVRMYAVALTQLECEELVNA